jgi:transcriptional regulator with XRE-family HTH domain
MSIGSPPFDFNEIIITFFEIGVNSFFDIFVYKEITLTYNAFMEVQAMSIHERLSALRANLGLTTRAFGNAINITGGAITNMEKGRRDITERTIRDICREYGVNQDWLASGTGQMFNDVLDGLALSDDVRLLTESYSHLGDKDKALIKNLIDSLAEK